MFRRSKSKRKGNSPFMFLFALIIGMVLAVGASVWATTVGTNISVTGTLTTNSSTASSSVSYALGVATTTPATALAVVGSTYTTLGLGAGVATTTSGALEINGPALLGGALNVTGITQLNGNVIVGDAAGDTFTITSNSITHSNVATTTIPAANAVAWNIATSSANIPFLRFDTSNYRIGISTTSPGATFSVAGDAYVTGSSTLTRLGVTGDIYLGDAQGDNITVNSGLTNYPNVSTTTILAANADAFNIATSSANIPFLKFNTSNYRIGISTTSPGATFSVAGNAYVTGNLSVGTNGTNVATIQHAWVDCGPITGAYTLAATTTGILRCTGNIPQGHAANDKVWLTASSTLATGPSQGWYDYTGKASSTAAGVIQVMIYNNSGATLSNANLGTTSWQLLLIK